MQDYFYREAREGSLKIADRVKFVSVKTAYLLIAIFLFAAFINLSWFDETLHPQIQALWARQPDVLKNSGYPLFYGFVAADDKDPLIAGRAVIEAQAALAAQGNMLSSDELESLIGGTGLDDQWQGNYKSLSCVARLSLSCAVNLAQEIQSIGINNSRLQILMARYENIQRQEHFRESILWEAYLPLPSYTQLMNVSRISLAAEFNQPESQHFLDFVANDLVFWKTMLRDGQLMIAKMVALAGIRNDLDYLSFAIRSGKFDDMQLASIPTFLLPLTMEESDIGEAFLAELLFPLLSSESLEQTYGNSTTFEKLLWQTNATINADYSNFVLPLQHIASLSTNEFYLQEGFRKLPYSVPALPSSLYNLAGKMALRDTKGNYNLQDYVARVHDLSSMINVVLLQADIALNRNGPIQEFANSSEYKNPYTLAPMIYDSSSGQLGIECMSSNESDLCKVIL